ncbi:MAG: TIGR00266 family protein [Synergistaceae bacterium]|nr:TIGR00266 family protein [Synergistaceae bacterium]MBQ9403626.1 TIGR00266 family protein [Synergistaceae bacterium]
MKYEILYHDVFSVVRCDLVQGESIKAESDAMITMSPNLDVEGSMGGKGIMGGLARKFLAGESFFFQRITASRGPGSVMLGHAAPGGIVAVDLDGTYGLTVQKDGWLASEESVNVSTKMQNLTKGLFSREGFFVLNVTGRGTVFLSSFGAIHPINLSDGEEIIIDNGHLVAWPDYMDYKIEKASSGWFSSLASGEGLVCRFKGPGSVLIQTRNPDAFTTWLRSLGIGANS